MKKCHVSFFTVANPGIGLGHLYRCDALLQAMAGLGVTADLYVESCCGIDWLKEKQIHAPFLVRRWTDAWESIAQSGKECDLIVIDAYNVTEKVWSVLAKIGVNLAVFDDCGEKPMFTGFLVNGSPGAKYIEYRPSDKRKLLLGTDFQVLRPPFWEKKDRVIKRDLSLVVVMVGGTDHLNVKEDLVGVLKGVIPEEVRIVSIGEGKINSGRATNVGFLSASQIKKLFNDADLLVSAAGQTVAEAVATELPMVMIQTSDNQRFNYRGWLESGACLPGGDVRDAGFSQSLSCAFQDAVVFSNREKMHENCHRLHVAESTRRLGQVLLKR